MSLPSWMQSAKNYAPEEGRYRQAAVEVTWRLEPPHRHQKKRQPLVVPSLRAAQTWFEMAKAKTQSCVPSSSSLRVLQSLETGVHSLVMGRQ